MLRVFKYPLQIEDHTAMALPINSTILHVHEQKGCAWIWALVDDEQKSKVMHRFRIAGTGHPLDSTEISAATYLGSVHLDAGALVFHVWELGKEAVRA